MRDTVVDWVKSSYAYAVVRRFVELELLDRSFGLAAQTFVAVLPLVILLVVFVTDAPGQVISTSVGDRFGLDESARTAVRLLFEAPGSTRAISWLALIMTALSAFSLSRRLSRVFAAILGLPSLLRSQLWRGLVWIALQVGLFLVASGLRAVRRDSGMIVATLLVLALLIVWFLADVAGLRLLVPTAPRRILIPSAIVSGVGRVGLAVWAAIYMPRALANESVQYGPIGVTFVFFTFILGGVLVYLAGPLLVSVWFQRRSESVSITKR
jgi:membrane protein